MRMQRHPETGTTYRRTRDGLFGLLAVSVALGALLNALASHLSAVQARSLSWWTGLVVQLLVGSVLIYTGLWWDDRRMRHAETKIELLLCYTIRGRTRRADLGVRRSYAVTGLARQGWRAAFGRHGLALVGREKRAFTECIEPEHMDLVRHLLVMYQARFGQRLQPHKAIYGWLQLETPLQETAWEQLHPVVRDNPISQAIGRARPDKLYLPQDTELVASAGGDVLLQLTWQPTHPWLCRLLSHTRRPPGGEVRVRQVGKLSELHPYDKPYEHLTARLGDLSSVEVHVVVTRLIVEVETRWNALQEVSRFRDWGVNLAQHLERAMSYPRWREYYLERTVDNLDWKIGWMDKEQEPSLAERLRRLDERLARLEAHLWPDEPAQGGGEGVWLSGADEEAASAADDTDSVPATDNDVKCDDVGG
jgi:hypothetical protein